MTCAAGFGAVDVIRAKRDRERLTDEQIDWVVAAYTRGDVADEQMAALAMAILLNGMDAREIARWTAAMIASGERLALPDVGRPLVDKHSTGGVGDKITLPLAPLVAACGAAVPQLSGRGLGHTGGTLDKLESIPGWRAELSLDEIAAQLADVGAVICATTPTLAPADRKLYALRDVTGTVESIPLIASSIMSKKIAEGTDGLVLDVKSGSGAFMKTAERARELAATMVDIGAAHGLRTTAVLTDMSVPLGRAVGNALEVAESVEVLRGGGPADVVDTDGRPGRGDAGAGRHRRRSGDGARLGSGVPGVGGDDRGAGRRPGGAAADRRAHRGAAGGPVGRAGTLRRAGRRRRGLAAGCRPGPQGARGAGGGGDPAAGRHRRRRRGRSAPARTAHRHPGRRAGRARRAGGRAWWWATARRPPAADRTALSAPT